MLHYFQLIMVLLAQKRVAVPSFPRTQVSYRTFHKIGLILTTIMDNPTVKVLLLADTHLGFDLPFRPRIERRRRGHDFFANYERALQPAIEGKVDLVVHGGDLFFRSKIPSALVEMAMTPILRVADTGTPVYIVPGNHERARLPLQLWMLHPNLHIFHEPKTFVCRRPQMRIALAGFPFARHIQSDFPKLLCRTGYSDLKVDARLLCLHQAVEGAQVGPVNFTFRAGPDVIPGRDIPGEFCAVLSGHIHRYQRLDHDLTGKAMATTVIYPGSVERTSFAERREEKRYAIVELAPTEDGRGRLVGVSFFPLPARPMIVLELEVMGLKVNGVSKLIRNRLKRLDPESIVRVKFKGAVPAVIQNQFTAAFLRSLAPETMNISLGRPRSRVD
jgi:exonuclease SbcD